MEKRIDSVKLKQVAKDNPKVGRVLKYFSTRDRGRRITSFTRLRNVFEETGDVLSKQELRTLVKPLEDAGAGHIVDRNDETYFEWDTGLNYIACDILGVPRPRYKKPEKEFEVSKMIRVTAPKSNKVTLKYGDFVVEADLDDLTEKSCEKMISLIKTAARLK